MYFQLFMFHNVIVKISEILNKKKVLKICIQTNHPNEFCVIDSNFNYGNLRIFD